ncbi:MAG: heat-inducible transcriptional repressor HrcA [Bacillota bacterium]|nr:heat-inducible transcriptional repressor HrcA [Bacillota bacterium]
MNIDERKIKILEAIIDDYINTAEPVGSRTIAKKYDLGISSATIRNEMADLEEMGYLEQLHTSSGRKPSDKGYRLYVDKLMHVTNLSVEEEYIIKNQLLNAALYEVDNIVKKATEILSELTKLTCIVKKPSVRKERIKSIQLINIDTHDVLTVIVTDRNNIKNTVIRLKKAITDDILSRLGQVINKRLDNLTIEEINLEVINSLNNDLRGYEEIYNAIIPVLYESLNTTEISDIYLEGPANILNYPEYNDITKAKEILSLLYNRNSISGLLDNNETISVRIGEENGIEGAKDCSVIRASYFLNDNALGTIGVIGPTRMPYSKIISIMNKIIYEINDNISNNFLDDR